jgi:hypothetical protein
MSELQASLLTVRPRGLKTDPFVQSWDWAYGQTPEFEYVINNMFQGERLVRLHSHVIIHVYRTSSISRHTVSI